MNKPWKNKTLHVDRELYEVKSWSNNGFLFEMLVTDEVNGRHFGQPGQCDVKVKRNGKWERIECKFFTMGLSSKGTPTYNYANGFDLKEGMKSQLLEGLREYCGSFDWLAVGTGDLLQEEKCEIEWFTSAEAYDFLEKRLMAMGADQVRFGYRIDRANYDERRRATLAKHGFAL